MDTVLLQQYQLQQLKNNQVENKTDNILIRRLHVFPLRHCGQDKSQQLKR